MKVLITGGGGFLGSHLARDLLKQGNEVSILGRNSYPDLGKSITCIQADIRDRPAMVLALKGQEAVFHTAAIPGIWGDYNEFYSIDVQGTENIIFACCENVIKKLIYTSSPSVIFDQSDMENIDEQTPYPDKYLCHYSKTKAMAEKMVGRENLKLILEPGRAIAANAGILVTEVEFIKEGEEKSFAIVDAAMNDLLRPALYSAWQKIIPVKEETTATPRIYDVVGPVCETGDFIGKDRELAIEPTDLLAVRSAGAYGFVMASNYNSRCRPAEIMVDGDKAIVVREREKQKDLWQGEYKLP